MLCKAIFTVYWAVLSGLKRNFAFFFAIRTSSLMHLSGTSIVTTTLKTHIFLLCSPFIIMWNMRLHPPGLPVNQFKYISGSFSNFFLHLKQHNPYSLPLCVLVIVDFLIFSPHTRHFSFSTIFSFRLSISFKYAATFQPYSVYLLSPDSSLN